MVTKLKPTARTKKRYLLLKGKKAEIERAMIEYLGILGLSKAQPFFVENSQSKTILSVERKSVDDVIASLALCADKIELIKVSGTIKGLEK